MTQTCNPNIWELKKGSLWSEKQNAASQSRVGILPAPGKNRTIPIQHGSAWMKWEGAIGAEPEREEHFLPPGVFLRLRKECTDWLAYCVVKFYDISYLLKLTYGDKRRVTMHRKRLPRKSKSVSRDLQGLVKGTFVWGENSKSVPVQGFQGFLLHSQGILHEVRTKPIFVSLIHVFNNCLLSTYHV